MEPRCLSVRRSRCRGVPPTFYTLDRDGRLLSSATASIPGSADVSLGDFDRRDDSSIVFIGEAHSAYGQPVPFIALISADCRTERVIRTAPYNANMLGLAPDGTFWTLGYEMVGRNVSAPELNLDPGVLRHFDRARASFLAPAVPSRSSSSFTQPGDSGQGILPRRAGGSAGTHRSGKRRPICRNRL